jgi:hypothetical protein
MRYRKQSADGDYVFGAQAQWLVNSPEAVAQAAATRMKLWAGEWFLDDREGLATDLILGYRTQATRDLEVQRRILETPGVKSILTYSSNVEDRAFTVNADIDTIYGQATIAETL